MTHHVRDFIGKPWLTIDELEVGVTYFCKARNFRYGVWNGKAFDYMREKFGDTYPATENHWDTGAPHGTVKPFVKRLVKDLDSKAPS
jgi:broad specificity phosphatase PhoE